MSGTNKKGILLCFSQACQNMNNPTKLTKKLEDSRDKGENNQPFLKNMSIPYDLNDIQPRATQVWNCDNIGFDINGKWNNVICTYKFFHGEQMCEVQTGEQSPL